MSLCMFYIVSISQHMHTFLAVFIFEKNTYCCLSVRLSSVEIFFFTVVGYLTGRLISKLA